jgi:hypothetical protein
MRTTNETSAGGTQARALALWVLVCVGLLYGVINTALAVTDLFGG